MKFFPKQVLKRFSTYIAVIVIFIYNVVLDRSLECTCGEQKTACIVYMTLPFFIVFVLQLWTEKTFQRVLNYTCSTSSDRCNLLCILFYHILKAAFIGLLWIVSVFIDGDWYVCCLNNGSENQAQLACKDKSDITPEERIIITELKNRSLVSNLVLHHQLLCAVIPSDLCFTCTNDLNTVMLRWPEADSSRGCNYLTLFITLRSWILFSS